MTKAIAALIIIGVLYAGWEMFLYWDKVKNEQEQVQKAEAASTVHPEMLAGVPQQLLASLEYAQREGASALRNWLKANASLIQDPRKAWVELDYCVMVAKENPSEARRIFAAVKQRTAQDSPGWPRISKLSRTFE